MNSFVNYVRYAEKNLEGVARKPELQYNKELSEEYGCSLHLLREDRQPVGSYKLRGAYNCMVSNRDKLTNGAVCASAGNHSQGFAFACNSLDVSGVVYMPETTPVCKIEKTKQFGKKSVEVRLAGKTFDDACSYAFECSNSENKFFVHPFDDLHVIAGQATAFFGLEHELDMLFVPVGGGGLAAGISAYAKELNPKLKVFGVEPEGSPSMHNSLRAGKPVCLETVDTFVDGAAVKKPGSLSFKMCKNYLDDLLLVSDELVFSAMVELYAQNVTAEPAGALAFAGLKCYEHLHGKRAGCIVSGRNVSEQMLAQVRQSVLEEAQI
jgi:threonine dehydratase